MFIETDRLRVRELTCEDASFILELVNSDGFINNIGDRGIRTIEQAKEAIENKYRVDYPNFGLFAVEHKATNQVLGTVSYFKRDFLEFDDIGYAFLPQNFGHGYAFEATLELITWAKQRGKRELLGVVNPDNHPSIRLLRKLGFKRVGTVVMENETAPILKYQLTI